MEKLNIAELLRHCPKDMELNCMMYEDVYFDYVDELNAIHCYIQNEGFKTGITFNQHGTPHSDVKSKCVIFPKGKTTWEGFVPPCKFKEGDILYIDCADKESDGDVYKYIFILKEIDSLGNHYSYCHLNMGVFFSHSCYLTDNDYTPRFATEKEKEKLFDAIKANGYKWNAETKTLEKLIVPNFKVGNRIKSKINDSVYTITDIRENVYIIKLNDTYSYHIPFTNETNYELVPYKFDITTLNPFDKVLVRDSNAQKWIISFFSHYDNNQGKYKYFCINNTMFAQCIPYEDNKHLSNKKDDCNDFYKNW